MQFKRNFELSKKNYSLIVLIDRIAVEVEIFLCLNIFV